MANIYDPNYYSGFSSARSLAPLKRASVLGNSWSGVDYSNGNRLTQQQNLRVNRNYQLYQAAHRSPVGVLTNNVTTLPQGNGSQFNGFGYTQTTGNNGSNIYV